MEFGTHIITPRTGFTHHAIYVSDDEVSHYAGSSEGLTKGAAERTSLEEFAQGKEVRVRTHVLRLHDHAECVARARSRLGEDDYNLVFNNCEHFVNWCVYGVRFSHQVNRVVAILANRLMTDVQKRQALTIVFEAAAKAATQCVGKKTMETMATAVGAASRKAVPRIAARSVTPIVTRAVAGNMARAIAPGAAGTIAGGTTAAVLGPTAITGVSVMAGAVGGGMVAVAAPVFFVALGVAYGVKKLLDCFD